MRPCLTGAGIRSGWSTPDAPGSETLLIWRNRHVSGMLHSVPFFLCGLVLSRRGSILLRNPIQAQLFLRMCTVLQIKVDKVASNPVGWASLAPMIRGLDIQVQMPVGTDALGFFKDLCVFGEIFKAALGLCYRAWIGLDVGSKACHPG